MSPTDRPPKALIAAMIAPLGIAGFALMYDALGGSIVFIYNNPVIGPLLLVALPIALAQGRPEGRGIGAHARRLAALSPCLIATLSVLYPWTVAPGKGFPAVGGFSYFIGWLTKYPNWGPINYEVLLGILCMLGASSIPVAFALYHVQARPPRAGVLGTILLLDLVAFIPLVIYLDFDHWRGAVLAFFDDRLFPRYIFFPLACGCLLRAAPVAVMLALAVRSLRAPSPAAAAPADESADA
jgi:hypothetical protein